MEYKAYLKLQFGPLKAPIANASASAADLSLNSIPEPPTAPRPKLAAHCALAPSLIGSTPSTMASAIMVVGRICAAAPTAAAERYQQRCSHRPPASQHRHCRGALLQPLLLKQQQQILQHRRRQQQGKWRPLPSRPRGVHATCSRGGGSTVRRQQRLSVCIPGGWDRASCVPSQLHGHVAGL